MASLTSRRVSEVLLALAGACFLVGMIVTVADVILRAVANRNVPAAIELTSLSIGLGAILSIPVCYGKRAHVTAKLLSEVSPARFSEPLGVVGGLASVVFALMLFWIAVQDALSRMGSPETTADLGLSRSVAAWVVTAALAAGPVAAVVALWSFARARRVWE
ncbi:MAG: hypothetical protein CML68_20250 [Rhodobacteraceae bacterium]|nr:hypothetical protein [Paracoccaceae bacterium]